MSITLHALLVVAAAVAVSLGARAVLGRFLRPDRVAAAQPTAEVVMEAMAGLYGVLVAFLLAGAWNRFDQARGVMTLEANALADLRQIARVLPAPLGDEVGAAAEAYRERTLEELPLLLEGRNGHQADAIIDRLWRILAGFEPGTPGQTELQSRALDALQAIGSQRRLGLNAIQRTLPPILWVILVGGAAAVLGLVAISSADGRVGAVYLALLAAVISFALFAIYALSYPVRSGLATEMSLFVQELPTRPPERR
ncbi:MAG TPA: DUF4239 domain-containing protein [Longimicrobiales bacterium]|nr:DUF4239 domain-containing protein [Longimicrobiales bacterium]